ncbi:unannotated protein [freshwater metagenome]|uniref:Unannotated protein n=1 Tax=freshwater metagenome TaxID=449393 RepID=A0A6J6CCG8_9ZZZZ
MPVITRVAAENEGVAITVTEVVPLLTLIEVPGVSASVPLTVKFARVFTVDSAGATPV